MKNLKFIYFAILLFLFLVIYEGSHFIPSSDLWWHLGVGRYILTNRVIPTTECFSYTAPGFPWLNHSWLADIIFFLLYQACGLTCLHIIKIIIICISFGLMIQLGKNQGTTYIACIIAACMALISAHGKWFFDVRPYIFTYLLAALFYYLLESARNKPKLLWLLPLIMLLWVNLHGGFLVGFFILIVFWADSGWQRIKGKSSDFALLGIITLLCLLITGINPAGYGIWKLFMGSREVAGLLNEWESPLATQWFYPYYAYLFMVFLGFLLLPRKNIRESLIFIFFGGLSLSSIRHVPLFCLLSVPFCAKFLNFIWEQTIKNWVDKINQVYKQTLIFLALLCLIIYSGLYFKNFSLETRSMEWDMFPHEGVKFLHSNRLPLKIFNPYEWGGYLILKAPQYPVFIDGRVNSAYPDQLYFEALTVMFANNGWERILNQYRVDLVICNLWQLCNGQLLPLKIARDPNWEIIYQDPLCKIFLRKTAKIKLKSLGIEKLHYPPTLYRYYDLGIKSIKNKSLDQAETYFQKALTLNPRYVPALINWGYVSLLKGNGIQGVNLFQKALGIAPKASFIHYNLGQYYRSKGDKFKAMLELKKELKVNPDFSAARKALLELSK